MYRLSVHSFEYLLQTIYADISPKGPGGSNHVPPIIKLCMALRFAAGGSYLDLSFGYDVPENTIHHYVMQVITAIAMSKNPFLDNIKSPIHCSETELLQMENGFAKLSNCVLRGTVAAGDGIVFRMQMPDANEVNGDVISYYTRKGYYAYGLQGFCDSTCKFVSISSIVCSSSGDNTAYIVTQLARDIKAGLLPDKFHIVFDEAYVCKKQEMSPHKGRNLSREKDAFNYYLSLNSQVIERAFGILVQRWGVLWRPLRLNMEHRGLMIMALCRLHNVCIDDFGLVRASKLRRNSCSGFEREDDGDGRITPQFIDYNFGGQGTRTDLELCDHRREWTEIVKELGLSRPAFSKHTKRAIRP